MWWEQLTTIICMDWPKHWPGFCYREQGASMNCWHRCGKEWFWPVHGGYHSATLRSFLNMAWGSLLHPILKDKWNICGLFFSKFYSRKKGREGGDYLCFSVSNSTYRVMIQTHAMSSFPWVCVCRVGPGEVVFVSVKLEQ